MVLNIQADHEVANAVGTFQIISITDKDGNDLNELLEFLTKDSYYDYHLEEQCYIKEIKEQLKEIISKDILDSIEIQLI